MKSDKNKQKEQQKKSPFQPGEERTDNKNKIKEKGKFEKSKTKY